MNALEVSLFTGIGQDYEEPKTPEIVVDTSKENVDGCVNKILKYLKGKKII